MVHTGVGSHVRILDMGLILDGVLETLPALHVISGCDSVSAVNGKGKAVVEYCSKERKVFAKCIPTGRYNKNQCRCVSKIEKLFCYLHGMPDETNVNETSYRKFCTENTPEPHRLPTIKYELTQHFIRAN